MCGIFAYTGERNAGEILLDGLTSLEYRGYDSAGIYTPQSGSVKSVGAVSHLRRKMPPGFFGTSGIAHLRWATHGEPTEGNAHPHTDCTGDVWAVHNRVGEHRPLLPPGSEGKGRENFSEKAAVGPPKEVKATCGIATQYKHDPAR